MNKPCSASNGVVFLSPEAPYPLAGGGAVRSASLLNYLARQVPVDLITFTEDDAGGAESFPAGLLNRLSVIRLPKHSKNGLAKLSRNGWRMVRQRLPLTDRFTAVRVARQVEEAMAGRRYSLAVAEHFWCAPYLCALRKHADVAVLDLHNVESAWHESCSRTESRLRALAHRRFAKTAQREERRLLPLFDLVLAASERDREWVLQRSPAVNVTVFPNSIPWTECPNVREDRVVAFSGNLEYHPNAAAVEYFKHRVWPALSAKVSGLRWRLIGKNEGAIRAVVADDPRIELTGAIDDSIREIARAQVVVVPVLSGSGTRVKILEAWAAARAVVSTRMGAEGLPAVDKSNVLIADDAQQMKEAVLRLLGDASLRRRLGREGRSTYERYFSWPAAWKTLGEPLGRVCPQLVQAVA